MSTTLLPAIRSKVGDWITYVTTMSFSKVQELVKSPDEIHERKALSEWIQREAIDTHASQISKYIIENEQRFLGSLIIGVYDGMPNWAPLDIDFSIDALDVTVEQRDSIVGKIGLLKLSGDEKLFAIDGQHRVAGIKLALKDCKELSEIKSDEVSVVFVSHDESTISGRMRTRRLFTTVNKKAKPVSKTATIALDEDNGFAIVTRMLIDSHWLFEDERKHISYTSTGAISSRDYDAITSVVGLYEICKDLYLNDDKDKFEKIRPSDDDISVYLNYMRSFFDELLSQCQEYNSVFVQKLRKPQYYRETVNHILFRPVGQRAFARSVQLLIKKRGFLLKDAISCLLGAQLIITSKEWHNILWDPVSETMITNRISLAETQLLELTGNEARTALNKRNLESLLLSRS